MLEALEEANRWTNSKQMTHVRSCEKRKTHWARSRTFKINDSIPNEPDQKDAIRKKTTTFLLHFQPFMGILCLSFRTFLSRDPRSAVPPNLPSNPRPGLNQASWSLDPQHQKLGMVNCDLERVGSKLERFKGSNILMPCLCIYIYIHIYIMYYI